MTKKSNTLPIGHRLHHYRIEAVLGAGGFGITYKAVHEALQKKVAIKEYFPVEWSYRDRDEVNVLANTQGALPTSEAGEDACYIWGLERFLNEARILAQIEHPGVVRVQNFFEANGTAYIVMDYEDGEPLSQVLLRERTIPEEKVRRLLDDVLPALEAVHGQGYLHRDLKPANLYIRSRDGRAVLIDFGAARQALGRRSKSVTSVFSPGYSPIEQYLVEGKGYGPWTDIYAIGSVLYHCVTGSLPLEAPGRVLDDPLKPAMEVAEGRYSSNLLRVIDKAIAVRPEGRFQSVAQMRAALLETGLEDGERTVKLEVPFRHDVRRAHEKPLPILVDNAPVAKPRGPFDWRWWAGGAVLAALLAVGVATLPDIFKKIFSHDGEIVQPPDGTEPGKSPDKSPPVKDGGTSHPTSESQKPLPNQNYIEPLTKMEFVWIPPLPGCFDMGSPNSEKDHSANESLHQVCLKGFWMSKYGTTNAQYKIIDPNHDSGDYESYSLNGPNQPVVRVSWHEAVTYAESLSSKTGLRFRLPTEAEWEYTARAGTTSSRFWGDDPSQACRYANVYDETARKALKFNWANFSCDDGQVITAPVGSYAPNPFGLYDMLGNAWQWTCSEYESPYAGAETRCAGRDATAGRRVLRGGSWDTPPALVRSAYRFFVVPAYRNFNLGFRLVLEP